MAGEKRVTEPSAADGGRRAGRQTILVVEDGAAVRRAVGFILRKNGYHVLEAAEARRALEVLQGHAGPVHLLLTDVMLPEISGPELVQMLGGDRPEMKVLFVSGHADRERLARDIAFRQGGFLRKPFVMEELLATVRELLGKDRPGD